MSTADDAATGAEVAVEVEVRRFVGGFVGLRGSSDPRKPYIVLSGREWRSFLARVKRGELDGVGARDGKPREHRP
jgi:hypothetical protein